MSSSSSSNTRPEENSRQACLPRFPQRSFFLFLENQTYAIFDSIRNVILQLSFDQKKKTCKITTRSVLKTIGLDPSKHTRASAETELWNRFARGEYKLVCLKNQSSDAAISLRLDTMCNGRWAFHDCETCAQLVLALLSGNPRLAENNDDAFISIQDEIAVQLFLIFY